MTDSKQQFDQLYDSYGNASVAPDPEAMGGIGLASTNSADNPLAPQALTSGVYQGILVIGSGQVQSQNFVTGESGWQIRADGTAEFSDIFIRGTLKTVSVGDSIQDAIDFLNQYGGGEVRLDVGTYELSSDIVLYANIHLVGSGIDATILDFNDGAYGIRIVGASPSVTINNWSVRYLTIKDSNAAGGLYATNVQSFSIQYTKATSCTQDGFLIEDGDNGSLLNCISDSNTKRGFNIATTENLINFSMVNCRASDNTTTGISLVPVSGGFIAGVNIISCVSEGNDVDGLELDDTNGGVIDVNLTNCYASSSGAWNYDINGQRLSINGCSSGNGTSAFRFNANCTQVAVIGNNPSGNFSIHADADVSFVGNNVTTTLSSPATRLPSVDTHSMIVGTYGGSATTERRVFKMLNDTGSTINAGEVVIIESNADGDEVQTTTTQGDSKVFGMMLETRASSSIVYGDVVIEGYTRILKVNGTTDIAIGDYLSCYSVAGIAAKAAAGDTVFAIALEAYTGNDSNGVIDAYILPWRFTLKADAASTTTAGTVELATAAETTTGTDATRAVTPDGLAGSDYGKRVIGIQVVDAATDTATGDGKAFFRIPSVMNGWNLVGVAMNVYTAGTTNTTDVQIRNITQTADMLSTKLTIDSGETDSSTAATPAVIDTNNDDVATGDKIAIDVDAVHTTAAKGLFVELIFQLP